VILATPSTLIALLKTVAYGWRQAAVAENAATIHTLGQELHKRLATFVKHLDKLGKQLNNAVDAYNSAMGSLERQVLPQARRFPELGVTADAALITLDPISQVARQSAVAALDAPPTNGAAGPAATSVEPAPSAEPAAPSDAPNEESARPS
jgi:DNA recombination protein RmuC